MRGLKAEKGRGQMTRSLTTKQLTNKGEHTWQPHFRVGDAKKIARAETRIRARLLDLSDALAEWERVRPVAYGASPAWAGVQLDANTAAKLEDLVTAALKQVRR